MSVLRAVIDTNVLVSAAVNAEGTPARVIAAIRERKLEPVLSREIRAEYEEVLSRARFRFPPALVAELLGTFEEYARRLEPGEEALPDLPDPGDAPFIVLARFAVCPVVTGNARHFPPEAGVEVLTPGECLAKVMARHQAG